MNDAIKRLKSHTIQTGSPFPYSVEIVDDLAAATPAVLTITTDGGEYRIADTEGDQATPRALRKIIEQLAPELKEYQQHTPDDESGTPET